MDDLRAALLEALQLKRLPRSGWLRVGVQDAESVAAHSWGAAWLVAALCPEGVDRGRALEMAVIHDLAEVRIGDITPVDGVPEEEKAAMEGAALNAMLHSIPHGSRLRDLWDEFEAGETAEARFARVCDKLDMGLQAIAYSEESKEDFEEWLISARAVVKGSGFNDLLG